MLAIATTPPSVLPRVVSVLLLLGLGVMAAQLTWQALEPDVRPTATVDITAESVAPTTAAATESPFATVARLPLFGVLGERAAPEPVVAPETRLRLRLVGLMASDAPEQGHAIIVESGSPERLYRVGDAVGGGQARLHQIHIDRVILERDGGYETLRLPRSDGSTAGAPASAAPVRTAAPAPAPNATDEPRIQRSEWLGDPERLLQTVRARPVIQGGVLHGLEVSPTRNARQFQQAGLRPGDVITSVNGIPLSAIDDADRLFQDLAGQLRVELVVERDGQALPLSIELVD
nr:type II secretion system protein GspC [Thioalkalivibrio sp.]